MKPPRTDWMKFLADHPAMDIVRLADAQWDELLAALAERSLEEELQQKNRRTDDRVRYEWRVRSLIRTSQPGSREPQTYLVYTRNISRGGIGLIHGMFLHAGTGVVVMLRTRDGACVAISGLVRWCNHLHGRLHEVGVQFEQPIDLDRFLDVKPPSEEPAQEPVENPSDAV